MQDLAELTSIEDPVFLSWLLACLKQEEIEATVLDQHTSAALGGAIGAIRARVLVPAHRLQRARWVLGHAQDGVQEGDQERAQQEPQGGSSP
ncbi:DUF2007 domain-containing protein [Roseospira marina]|uniref:DUF2007 domain-containing protein n=1 Tax=Roseospira marina TaxID=140057 RepID=A0A5M6I8G0_9PROT|nr:DUF2007 domain-containing protein [Roseospira marina]KAA5604491.1 DUF2007 domain-containing protein [Roseospira marina]MBB4315543.1 hypothetical protein [Roseospira marina]MBB5088520.1 hypothetical protein [Roseospira marina]